MHPVNPGKIIRNSEVIAKAFKEKCEAKMEFPDGWGGDLKQKLSVGGVGIFSGTTCIDF